MLTTTTTTLLDRASNRGTCALTKRSVSPPFCTSLRLSSPSQTHQTVGYSGVTLGHLKPLECAVPLMPVSCR